jgi:hypothetical protein
MASISLVSDYLDTSCFQYLADRLFEWMKNGYNGRAHGRLAASSLKVG